MPKLEVCDLCYPETINEVADVLNGKLRDDGRKFRLLLCETHVKEFLKGIPTTEPTRGKAFAARLSNDGRTPLVSEADLPQYGKLLDCPYCDKRGKAPQGLTAHVRGSHTKADYAAWHKDWKRRIDEIRTERSRLQAKAYRESRKTA